MIRRMGFQCMAFARARCPCHEGCGMGFQPMRFARARGPEEAPAGQARKRPANGGGLSGVHLRRAFAMPAACKKLLNLKLPVDEVCVGALSVLLGGGVLPGHKLCKIDEVSLAGRVFHGAGGDVLAGFFVHAQVLDIG